MDNGSFLGLKMWYDCMYDLPTPGIDVYVRLSNGDYVLASVTEIIPRQDRKGCDAVWYAIHDVPEGVYLMYWCYFWHTAH